MITNPYSQFTSAAFENVGAGKTAFVQIPFGPEYPALMLDYDSDGDSDPLITEIDAVRLMLNSDTAWELSASELNTINQGNGYAAAANGRIILPFVPKLNNTNAAQELRNLTALRTGEGMALQPDGTLAPYSLRDVRLEVDIAAAATAPTLRMQLWQRNPDWANEIRFIRRLRKSTRSLGSGVNQIVDIPKSGLLGSIRAVHVFHSNVTDFKLTFGGTSKVREGKAADSAPFDDMFGYSQVSGCLSIYANHWNMINYNVLNETHMELELTTSGTDTVQIVTDTVAPLAA